MLTSSKAGFPPVKLFARSELFKRAFQLDGEAQKIVKTDLWHFFGI